HRRTKVAVELLSLRKGEEIGEGGEFGFRKALRHKAQERGRFGKRAAIGYQCGNPPFGVYRQVFRAPLALRAKIDQNRLVRRVRHAMASGSSYVSKHRDPRENTMTDDAAWPLARHVCRTDYADLPATAVASARREILDTFGCMLGGSGSPGFDELFAMIRRQP